MSPTRQILRTAAAIVIAGTVLIAGFLLVTSDNGITRSGGSSFTLDDDELVLLDQIPGDPRENVPSALDDRFDPRFPDPIVDPAEIRSGGPPPDGIPPIDNPKFQRVGDVDWLTDREPVLLVEIDGDARAYPIQILTWHEIVNDTFGDRPVTVSYCPLCNSAIAYDRTTADGRVLDFGTSGSLFNSALVMYDRQTESLWSHFTGEAVVGYLTGTQIDLIPVATVSWEDFRTNNPDGLVLSRDTGFTRTYGQNPYVGYDDIDSSPFLFDGEVDGQLPPQARVVAIRQDGDSVAVLLDFLFEERVVETEVAGRELVVFLEPGTASALDSSRISDGRDVGTTGVFVPVVGEERLTFEATAEGFRDQETGSAWNVLGRAVDGPLAGEQLERVEHLDTFWFAIGAFEPDTRLVGLEADRA